MSDHDNCPRAVKRGATESMPGWHCLQCDAKLAFWLGGLRMLRALVDRHQEQDGLPAWGADDRVRREGLKGLRARALEQTYVLRRSVALPIFVWCPLCNKRQHLHW